MCENRDMKRYELTKEQWERIKPLLPPMQSGKRGRPRKDDRTMLNGMLWITRSGAQWWELPEVYGPWQSVYARFAKWRDDGTLEAVFRALSADADMENLSLDSTCIKVHESANRGGKTADKAIGRTRGGLNTKLHTICRWTGEPS
jgi:transposase